MMNDHFFDSEVEKLLSGQNLGVLATNGEEYPYTSLVGFAATKDLKSLLFVTSRKTRKYDNLKRDPKVTVLINSGINSRDDFNEAVSITALGEAEDASEDEQVVFEDIYIKKFPFLKDFVKDPANAMVKVTVSKFIIVTRFQEVREIGT